MLFRELRAESMCLCHFGIRLMVLLLVFVGMGAIAPGPAFAVGPYTSQFNTFYGTSAPYTYDPVVGSCLTCHPSGSARNTYANDWRSAGYDFFGVELLDSDGDGFDNITEINAGTMPGDANSFPVVADNTAPQVTAFTIPAGYYMLTIPIEAFTATDNMGVTGYLLTESSTAPAASQTGWQASAPVEYGFSAPGTKTLYAWAKDAAGNVSAAASAQTQVESFPLIADAGLDQTVASGDTVTLDGSNSAPLAYGISSYSWTQDSGTAIVLSDSGSIQPTFQAPAVAPGTGVALGFTLTLTDIYGNTYADATVVNVSNGNEPPVADSGLVYNVNMNDTVVLDATGSTDPDDGIASYSWVQTGGTPQVTLNNANSSQPTFTAPEVPVEGAALSFELTVTDFGGLQSTDVCTVNVAWVNTMPWANIPGVVTVTTSTGEMVGIEPTAGVQIAGVTDVDPATIPNSTQKPADMVYGLIDLSLNVNPGATGTVLIHLPIGAPTDYHWYKYNAQTGEWTDYCHTDVNGVMGAVFDANLEVITLTLVDGGIGDDDGIADGTITDPSGLGAVPGTLNTSSSSSSSWGSGGGCFIATAVHWKSWSPTINQLPGMLIAAMAVLMVLIGLVAGRQQRRQ